MPKRRLTHTQTKQTDAKQISLNKFHTITGFFETYLLQCDGNKELSPSLSPIESIEGFASIAGSDTYCCIAK